MKSPPHISRAMYRRIVWWCADECRRQNSGELSVARMFNAWDYAMSRSGKIPRVVDVLTLGRKVDHEKNELGYRQGEIAIRHHEIIDGIGVDRITRVACTADQVPRQITALMLSLKALPCPDDAEEFFMRFETTHPFRDGNGRVGAILYNWLKGSLDYPEPAPEYRKPSPILKEA